MLSQSSVDEQENGRHIAAIDLGSNSFHMVIAKTSHGELRILDKFGEKVQLAAGMDKKGRIDEAATERALACLERFAQRIREFNAEDVQIVGTNALRVAKNRKQFIAKAEKVIGFPIEVISGREEARLIYLGVSHTMADDTGKRLVMDIGGGSTEFIIGERFEPLLLESLHMGCVSYRDRFIGQDSVTEEAFEHAVLQASRELLIIRKQYKNLGWSSAVGSSGSAKAVSQALQHCGISDDGSITLDGLKQLKKRVFELTKVERLVELGVKPERSTTFSSGLAILYASFKSLGIERMSLTSGALREGLLYDILGRIEHEDVRNRTIQAIQSRYHVDTTQADLVAQTAIHAYQQLAKPWKMQSALAENLLRWASQIYELGNTISHTQHHKHGAYLIEHSDLPGFTNRVQSLLSVIVRLHRRRFAEEVLEPLAEEDQILLKKLSIVFRLAIVLTASRVSAETDFQLNSEKLSDKRALPESLSLDFGSNWLSEHPLTQANLLSESDYLAKVGIELKIQ